MKSNAPSRPFYQHLLIGESTADVECTTAHPFGDHWHSEIEILYHAEGPGTVTVTVDQELYSLPEDSAIIIGSSAVHAITDTNPDCKMLYIKVGHSLLGRDYTLFSGKRFRNPFVSFQDPGLTHLLPLKDIFLQLISIRKSITEGSTDFDRLAMNACLYQIAVILARHFPTESLSAKRTRQLESVMAVQTVLSYIEDAYPHPITLEYAATLAGYEKTRFCQLFKQAVGTSFHKYLTDRRLRAAVTMLRETNLPVSAIGESVGILQPKTFSRLIRENYGKTPSEIRIESIKKGENIP